MNLSGLRTLLVWCVVRMAEANWQEWWTYDGISGPSYWGVINPAWTMCNKGLQQSPIDIDPSQLIHDPRLNRFAVDKHALAGTLQNTGQSLVFKVEPERMSVNITGGPLTYRYQFEQLFLHWGSDSTSGSEHSVAGRAFPAEIQLYGFNAHLFRNLSEGVQHPHGAVGVAIMVQEADERKANRGIRAITQHLKKVKYRGRSSTISDLNLSELLPNTDHFMTYEGSATYPGCWETVTWVVLNKPIYISRHEMSALRQLMQGDDEHNPKAPLGNNRRPKQRLNNRSIRTNIAFTEAVAARFDTNTGSFTDEQECPEFMREMYYKGNPLS